VLGGVEMNAWGCCWELREYVGYFKPYALYWNEMFSMGSVVARFWKCVLITLQSHSTDVALVGFPSFNLPFKCCK
jgi:hypothetical protein